VKNATEAIAAVPEAERGPSEHPREPHGEGADGFRDPRRSPTPVRAFPVEGRQRLLEPYLTTREGGTGPRPTDRAPRSSKAARRAEWNCSTNRRAGGTRAHASPAPGRGRTHHRSSRRSRRSGAEADSMKRA
jgi:hypothetical protein